MLTDIKRSCKTKSKQSQTRANNFFITKHLYARLGQRTRVPVSGNGNLKLLHSHFGSSLTIRRSRFR
jgi:hypothetical protein